MSPSSRVPLHPLFAVLVAGSVLLAGCNVGTGGGGSASPNATTPAATATTKTGGGGYGGGGDEYPVATPKTTAPSSPSAVAHEISVAQSATLGAYLTGEDGMTLYTYQPDTASASNCNGSCAQNWPPFVLEAGETATAGTGVSGVIGSVTRTDGTTQVTYGGHPVYYHAAATAAGDTAGEGIGGVWHVVKP